MFTVRSGNSPNTVGEEAKPYLAQCQVNVLLTSESIDRGLLVFLL